MIDLEKITWERYHRFLLFTLGAKNSSNNLSAYKSRLHILKTFFEGKDWCRDNFELFLASLAEKGHKDAYLNVFLRVGRHIDKILETNVLKDFKYRHEIPPETEVLTPQEVKRIMDVYYPYKRLASEYQQRDKTAIQFLFDTMCRPSELADLFWKDVRNTPDYHVYFRDTKSREDRICPITEDLYNSIMNLPRYGERVFDSRTGKRFDTTTFNRHLKKRCELAGVSKNAYGKIFRHSNATYQGNINFPVMILTDILGHRSPEVTQQRYYHPTLQQLSMINATNPLHFTDNPIPMFAKIAKNSLVAVIDPNKINITVKLEGRKAIITIEEVEIKSN